MMKIRERVSERVRKALRRFFRWVFRDECAEFEENLDYIREVVGDKEASCNADIHMRTPSWAVVNLRGKCRTYMKFIRMDDKTVLDVAKYLRQFEEVDVDATPETTKFIFRELDFGTRGEC